MAEKSELGRVAGLAFFDGDACDGLGGRAAEVPVGGVAVRLAGGAVAGAEPGEVEPRMALEKLDEMLAHHSGGAEDAYFVILCFMRVVIA